MSGARKAISVIPGDSCFVLRGEFEVEEWSAANLVEISEESLLHDSVWVLLADSYNSCEVRSESLESAPELDLDEWEDAVEFSVRVVSELVVSELLEDAPFARLIDSPGDYRLRVRARGRIEDHSDEDGEDPPEDTVVQWVAVQAWPAPFADPMVLKQTSDFAGIERERSPEVPEEQAGLEAAARIGRDVDGGSGGRVLSGALGSVRVERAVRGTRRRLFSRFSRMFNASQRANEASWIHSFELVDDMYAVGVPWAATASALSSDTLPGRGSIVSWFVEVEPPKRVVRGWRWAADPPSYRSLMEYPAVLPQDTMLTLEFEQFGLKDDGMTMLRVLHAHVPVEWVDDLRQWWELQLAYVAVASDE